MTDSIARAIETFPNLQDDPNSVVIEFIDFESSIVRYKALIGFGWTMYGLSALFFIFAVPQVFNVGNKNPRVKVGLYEGEI